LKFFSKIFFNQKMFKPTVKGLKAREAYIF